MTGLYDVYDEIGCIDPESGCDLCERRCDWCRPATVLANIDDPRRAA